MSTRREYKRKAKKRAEQEGLESAIEGLYEHGKRRLVSLAKSADEDKEKFQRRQAQVGLASNALGIAAGTAALATAAKNPALRPSKATMSNAGPVTRRIAPKLKSLKGKKGLIMAGAGGALALQGANLGGDVVANRVLSREAGVNKSDKAKDAAIGGAVGAAGGALSGTVIDRTFRAGERAANAPLRGAQFRAKGAGPAVGSARDRAEMRAKGSATVARARGARFLRRNKGALIGAAALGGLSAIPMSKSVEQSYVSKSDEVAITGHGVNLAKSANGSRGVIGDKEWEGSAKRRARSEGAAGAAVGGTLGGAAGFSAAKLARRGNRRIAAAGAAAGAVAGAAGLGSARYQSRKKRAMDPKMRRMAEATVMRQTVNEMRANGKNVTVNTAKWPELADVAKRQFDAEADRQRRLGLYAGLGALGAGAAGAAAATGLKTEGRRKDGQLFRLAAKDGKPMSARRLRGKAGLAALAAASGIGGVAAYRRGISERNYPYN